MCKLNCTFIFLAASNRQRRINNHHNYTLEYFTVMQCFLTKWLIVLSFHMFYHTMLAQCIIRYDELSNVCIKKGAIIYSKCQKMELFFRCLHMWLFLVKLLYIYSTESDSLILYFPATNHIKLKLFTYAYSLHILIYTLRLLSALMFEIIRLNTFLHAPPPFY